jgi:HdeA/HdeB family
VKRREFITLLGVRGGGLAACGARNAWNIAMKKLIAFYAITGLLLAEATAEDRADRIDLTRFTCKQFLELNRDDALIVVGWLQGHYLDEHETPVVDFTKLSVEGVNLANRCKARPDENVITAADRVFGK